MARRSLRHLFGWHEGPRPVIVPRENVTGEPVIDPHGITFSLRECWSRRMLALHAPHRRVGSLAQGQTDSFH